MNTNMKKDRANVCMKLNLEQLDQVVRSFSWGDILGFFLIGAAGALN